MIGSIIRRFKTRHVNPPGWYAFQLEDLGDYLKSAPYRWERTDNGVRGTLDKGFGRTYSIEWNEKTGELQFENDLRAGFLFFGRSENSTSTQSGMDPKSVERVKSALAAVTG